MSKKINFPCILCGVAVGVIIINSTPICISCIEKKEHLHELPEIFSPVQLQTIAISDVTSTSVTTSSSSSSSTSSTT